MTTQSLAGLQTDPVQRAHLLQDAGEDVARPQWLVR
jgi:hypothetical protein